jgi:hypothetical protein
MSFNYNAVVNRSMENALKSAMIETVSKLSKKYDFDFQEAIAYLALDDKLRVNIGTKPKEPRVIKRKQPEFPIPFSGEMIENCCSAILPNKGLYSQCLNDSTSNGFCSSCSKKFPSGNPVCGTVSDRIEKGEDYTDPKGKKPIHFTQIMKKLNLTEQFVLSEVTKYNIPFDTNHFVEPQTKRGRPKKEQTDSSPKTTRPKKATNQIDVSIFENDLLQQLVDEDQLAPTPAPPAATLPPAYTLLPAPTLPSEPTMPKSASNLLNLSLQKPDHLDDEEQEDDISDLGEGTPVDDTCIIQSFKKQEKQEKAKKEAPKKEKEPVKKEAAKKEKEAEKAKKEEEKAKKEAAKKEKEAEKAKKEEEKAKKEAEKAKKEEEKAKKEAEKAKKEVKSKKEEVKEKDIVKTKKVEVVEPHTTKPTATIFEYEGKNYYLKDDNSVYDMEKTQVGYWIPKDKIISFENDEEYEDDEEEEEEDKKEEEEEDEEEEELVEDPDEK